MLAACIVLVILEVVLQENAEGQIGDAAEGDESACERPERKESRGEECQSEDDERLQREMCRAGGVTLANDRDTDQHHECDEREPENIARSNEEKDDRESAG